MRHIMRYAGLNRNFNNGACAKYISTVLRGTLYSRTTETWLPRTMRCAYCIWLITVPYFSQLLSSLYVRVIYDALK